MGLNRSAGFAILVVANVEAHVGLSHQAQKAESTAAVPCQHSIYNLLQATCVYRKVHVLNFL